MIRNRKVPAGNARCEKCGSAELSSLPTFALGCGLSARAIADDVICRRCGTMGQPAYAPGKPSNKTAVDQDSVEFE